MIVTYDPDVDAAYIQLAAEILTGGVAKTYPCDPREIGGMINLDFDSEREISRCRDNGRQPVATTRNPGTEGGWRSCPRGTIEGLTG